MFPPCEIVSNLPFSFWRFRLLTCSPRAVESFYNTEISEMPLNVAESVLPRSASSCMIADGLLFFQSHLNGFRSTLSSSRVGDRVGAIVGGSNGVRSDITNLICCNKKCSTSFVFHPISRRRRLPLSSLPTAPFYPGAQLEMLGRALTSVFDRSRNASFSLAPFTAFPSAPWSIYFIARMRTRTARRRRLSFARREFSFVLPGIRLFDSR